MAKVKIFAVWDNAVGSYNSMHDALTEGVAIRNFSDVASNAQSPLAKHPNDFSLHMLGEFDTVTGLIECLKMPKNLGSAASLSITDV